MSAIFSKNSIYQEEVAPQMDPGMTASTVNQEAVGSTEKRNKMLKKPVRISAWKLAKLDSGKAVKVAAKARASSSVLRPVDNHGSADAEQSSSENVSVRSSLSVDIGPNKATNNDWVLSSSRNSFPLSQGCRDEYETGSQSASSFSSPSHVHESVALSPIRQAHDLSPNSNDQSLALKTTFASNSSPLFHTSVGVDEQIIAKGCTALPLSFPAQSQSASLKRDVKKMSVLWDQEAGEYVPVPVSATDSETRSSLQTGLENSSAGSSNHDRGSAFSLQEPLPPNVEKSEKLRCTGGSIFFGGPFFNHPIRDSIRNKMGSGSQDDQVRPPWNSPSESKSDASSKQHHVFTSGGS